MFAHIQMTKEAIGGECMPYVLSTHSTTAVPHCQVVVHSNSRKCILHGAFLLVDLCVLWIQAYDCVRKECVVVAAAAAAAAGEQTSVRMNIHCMCTLTRTHTGLWVLRIFLAFVALSLFARNHHQKRLFVRCESPKIKQIKISATIIKFVSK